MKNKVLIKSAVCLLAIVLVGGAILATLGILLKQSDKDRLLASVSFFKAEGISVLYDANGTDSEQHKIVNFNKEHGGENKFVSKVWQASGGQHDGGFLFQCTGSGYVGSPVSLYVGLDKKGAILGIKTVKIGNGNTWAHLVDWNKASDNLAGKTTVSGAGDVLAGTGATGTVNGAAEAISLALLFYKNILNGVVETPQIVTDTALLARLNTLFEVSSSLCKGEEIERFVSYPVTTPEQSVMEGKARVTRVYTADYHLIIEVKSRFESFGGWTLLVLVTDDGKVSALNPLANEIYVSGSYDASALDSAEVLTSLFAGKLKEDIGGMDEYLHGTTGATETNVGLKLTVYHALNIIDDVRARIDQFGEVGNE